MKYSLFSFIIVCTIFTLVPTGCENTELRQSISIDDEQITLRTTCNDCPQNYCCSSVQNLGDDPITLSFCGVVSPDLSSTTCSDTWGNCTISGYILNMYLDESPDTEIFCVAPNSTFRVQSSNPGSVRITCQYGQLTPVSIDLYFPGTNYVYVDGDCVVSGHCPF